MLLANEMVVYLCISFILSLEVLWHVLDFCWVPVIFCVTHWDAVCVSVKSDSQPDCEVHLVCMHCDIYAGVMPKKLSLHQACVAVCNA